MKNLMNEFFFVLINNIKITNNKHAFYLPHHIQNPIKL